MSPSRYDDSLREALRGVLLAAVRSGPGATGGIGSVQCQAVAALYVLLVRDHAVDRWGRCRSCRRPGAVFGPWRRRCRVHSQAMVWRRQPEKLLLGLLADELGLATDSSTDPFQTPAIPSVLPRLPADPLERDGRTQITAGSGMIREGPRSRRAPSSSDPPLLPTGGLP